MTLPRDHPRIRGEHRACGRTGISFPGSSPHTRGAPMTMSVRSSWAGIIPAYAGSTWRRTGRLRRLRDHPRIRGEHILAVAPGTVGHGSSPHTRGALAFSDHVGVGSGIIPAYAGSTVAEQCTHWVRSDHPRIRGEHSIVSGATCTISGSSPHTRGAPTKNTGSTSPSGIIPAYAGSTGLCNLGPEAAPDHPRIRGEHPPGPATYCPWPGSSPHTRGARFSPLCR